MDALQYLWAAGYTLPSEPLSKPVEPKIPAPRRGKKAARAKREKGSK